MRKQLQRQDSSFHFRSNHPGCLWAILHLLDYHRWHNVKNMLPQKSNGRLRHPKGNGASETVLKGHDAAQVAQYFNKEAQILQVERQTEDIVGLNNKLGNSVATAKETIGKGKTTPTEPSRQKIAKNSSKFKKNKTAEKSEQYFVKEFQTEKQELRQVNRIDKDISEFLRKEPVDILEMFKLNKKLFAEMLRGEEFGPKKLFHSRNSNTKVVLTKSMSFPVVDPSRIRLYRPSKLEHKQNESFPKGKNIRPATPASKSTRNLHEKSTRDKSDGSPPDVKQQGWNQLVVNRFNAIKQKVKQAFKDKRKGYSRLSVKEIPESSDHLSMAEDGMIDVRSVDETDGKDSYNIDGTAHSVKETSFSIETLERYKHLFAKSFTDNTKCRHSRSLTLATGHKILKNRLGSRSFNRNLSSPDLELFCSFFHDVSLGSSQADKPIINSPNRVMNSRTETYRNSVTATVIMEECKLVDTLDAELENRTLEELDHAEEFALVASEIIDEQDELTEDEFTFAVLERNPSQDLPTDCKLNDEIEFSQSNQVSDDETCSPDHLTSSPELPISGGMDSESIPKDEQMVSNAQPLWSSPGSITAFSNIDSHANAAMTDKIFDKQAKVIESNGIENKYYYHVKNIFKASGLIESELVGTCRSDSGNEIESELDQQLVFDLVNEALLDISETSSTYFHKAFSSFSGGILPLPSGDRLLEAVWKRIGRHLSRPQELQLSRSLEDVVGMDLANRNDGLMKLQLEAEFLALDVEDLIIDQLLGELMCS